MLRGMIMSQRSTSKTVVLPKIINKPLTVLKKYSYDISNKRMRKDLSLLLMTLSLS